jgi:hypothetical protein
MVGFAHFVLASVLRKPTVLLICAEKRVWADALEPLDPVDPRFEPPNQPQRRPAIRCCPTHNPCELAQEISSH